MSTEAIPDMESGTVDIIAGANDVSFFQAEETGHGQSTVLVDGTACSTDTFEILALPGSRITSPAGLAHKTVAVNVKNNIQTLLTNTALKTDGVNPATVTYMQIRSRRRRPRWRGQGGRHQRGRAVQHRVGAGRRAGHVDLHRPIPDFPISGYFTTQKWTQQYPNTARVPGGDGRIRRTPTFTAKQAMR